MGILFRYLYYSVSGYPPRIYRAELDGSDDKVLVEFNSWSTEGPSALALDDYENYLYWTAASDQSLQYVDLRYPNSEIVYYIPYSRYLHDPKGLALDAHYFYWTDSLLGNVVGANRHGDHKAFPLIPFQYSPGGVHIHDPLDAEGMIRVTFGLLSQKPWYLPFMLFWFWRLVMLKLPHPWSDLIDMIHLTCSINFFSKR